MKADKSTIDVHASSTHFENWEAIDWHLVVKKVKALQHRIVKATKLRQYRKVKSLQYILSQSFFAKLLAIRKVTSNKGKNTPGVDGSTWKSDKQKWMAAQNMTTKNYKARPLKRVFIPKSNGKKRPLAIPTMKDRAIQALYLQALDPLVEVLSDNNSYGFRKHRACADAIEQNFTILARKISPKWILEADIKACFDNISQQWLLDNIIIHKKILKQWLNAEIVFKGKTSKSRRGTPQGGIISPTLANAVLNGLEKHIQSICQIKFDKQNYVQYNPLKVHFVRYADDFVITAKHKQTLTDIIIPAIKEFLSHRGLSLSKHKTKITHINEGFDFLGFNIRKYQQKLLIKPAKKNIKLFRNKVLNIIRNSKAISQEELINRLNPILKGWANYFKNSCAKLIFTKLDHDIWKALWNWAKRRHSRKPRQWIKDKYFKPINNRQWIFNVDQNTQIFRLETVCIKRHIKVRNGMNPYDKNHWTYFDKRKNSNRVRK